MFLLFLMFLPKIMRLKIAYINIYKNRYIRNIS